MIVGLRAASLLEVTRDGTKVKNSVVKGSKNRWPEARNKRPELELRMVKGGITKKEVDIIVVEVGFGIDVLNGVLELPSSL